MSTPTIPEIEKFITSDAVAEAVAEALVKTAEAEAVKEHTEGYLAPAFAAFRPIYDDYGDRIANHEHLFTSDDPAEDWYDLCDKLHRENGYILKPRFCPASIADSAKVRAESALVKLFTDRFCDGKEIYNTGRRRELLDLMYSATLARSAAA